MVHPFSQLKDDKLMELYKNGDDKAFEVIYSRYRNNIYSYLWKRLNDKSDVDDLFQKVFIKFHKSRDLYSANYALIKWIYTICRSELLDHIKKKKITFVELDDDHPDSIEVQEDSIIQIDSEKSLSAKEKEAIKLRYYSDNDFSEISAKLQTSDSNSRKLISRGIQKLRNKYSGGAND